MNTIQRTPAIVAALTEYWNAYHIWQVCRADPCAGYDDLKNCADMCSERFEHVCQLMKKQHLAQHKTAPRIWEIRNAVKDEIVDIINDIYAPHGRR